MSTNTVSKDLMFPQVGATLYIPQVHEWYISLHIFGPNLRYTPAVALIYSRDVQKFCQLLQKAVVEMQRLEQGNYGEAASKRILCPKEISSRLSLHIRLNDAEDAKESGKKVRLCFEISSKTQTFKRSCTTQEVQTIITKLEGTEETVAALKQSSLELLEPLAAKY